MNSKPNVDNNGIYLLKFSSIHSKTTRSPKYLRLAQVLQSRHSRRHGTAPGATRTPGGTVIKALEFMK